MLENAAWELTAAGDLVCCGMVHGIIGKLNPFPGELVLSLILPNMIAKT